MNVNHICKVFSRYFGPDQGVSSGSKLCLTLVGYKQKKHLSGNFFAKRFLIDVCNGATLQIGHEWTIDFLVKAFDSLVFLGNLFGEHMLIYVLMSILLINFAWFWSKCCFQIPGPCVRGHLLYNKCRTCTLIAIIFSIPNFNIL